MREGGDVPYREERLAELRAKLEGDRSASDALETAHALLMEAEERDWLFRLYREALAGIDRAIASSADLAEVIRDVLGVVMEMFQADCVLLIPTGDLQGSTQPHMVSRPGRCGGGGFPPCLRQAALDALAGPRPVQALAGRQAAPSALLMALAPRSGPTWTFVVLQQVRSTPWNDDEVDLFGTVGGRITGILNTIVLTQALAESLDAHRLLMEHASDGIVLADSGGLITALNERARELLGSQTAAMLGRPVMETVTEEGGGPMALDSILAGETLVTERSLLRPDGLRITLECSVRLIGGSTIQVIMRDISERRRVERERLRAQRMELIGLLASGISHDFNNVMAIIMNNMELARMRTPHEGAIYIDRALEAVHRGRSVVEGLLSFSSGAPSGCERLDIGTLAREIAGLMGLHGGTERRRVDVRAMPGLWGVEGHADEVRQVLISLCQQALAAPVPASTGPVILELDNVAIPGKYRPAGSPNGEFVRLSLPDAAGASPTGGFSVPAGIVEGMGGWMEGEGPALHIYFPRSTVPAARSAPGIASSLAGGSETVLLVEDEAHLAEATTDMLELLGYRVHAAHDAEAALALYRRMGGGVDLVITDFLLPNASGLDLVREVLRERPDQAVIFTTGHAGGLRDLSFPADARVSVLMKPYSYESLASLMRETLGGPSAAAPLRLKLNRVRLSLVSENAVPHAGTIANTSDVYELFRHLADSPREKFIALFLDARKKIIGYDELAQGTANEVVVYPQEVVRSALLANAAAIILVHNHPGGGTAPSDRDIEVTRLVAQACSLFAIEFLDHVIIGRDGFFAFTAELD